jgi:predicted nucleotide-binding protein (sugar kinase/HSP70/actin superfamily)
MKITFPHMGNAYIAVRVLLDTLGLDYCMPSVGNRQALQKGIDNSPEFMCLPFKTVLANLIEGLEQGADTILFGGSPGQCRVCYFGELEQKILRDMGFSFSYIPLDFTHLTYGEVKEKFGPFLKGKSGLLVACAVACAGRTVFAVDALYKMAAHIRCREAAKGACDRIMTDFERRAQRERGYPAIRAAIRQARRALARVPVDPKADPLKIAVIGEIFIASEPFTNLEVEKKLGNLGAEVFNTLGVANWVRDSFLHAVVPFKRTPKAVRSAQAYLRTRDVGGHGVFSVGDAELLSGRGYDGILHIYPFTCMPEIVAQAALPAVRSRHGVPIMTLIVDEMTSEAGYVTRLEAFVDLLRMRRKKRRETASASRAPSAPPAEARRISGG